MRRLSLTERFEAMRQMEQERLMSENGPSPEQVKAARHIVDAFGVVQTAELGPSLERLADELVNLEKRDGGTSPATALQRLGEPGGGKFIMVRDWDPTEPKK